MKHDVILKFKCRGHHLVKRCDRSVQLDWANIAKLSKLNTQCYCAKKLEICANKCIAADLGQIEHTRTFVQSIELLQISGQWGSGGCSEWVQT